MSGDADDDFGPEVGSEWARDWLEARAAEQGVSPGVLLRRFAAAFRAAEEGEVPDLVFQEDVDELASSVGGVEATVSDLESALDGLDASVDELESSLSDVEADVSDLEADVESKIADVRERVVQVKREADAKADADHDHPELVSGLSELAESTKRTQSRLAAIAEEVEGLDSTVSEGFENYEEILSYLTDTVDDLDGKSTRLARAFVSLRDAMEGIASREERRMAADRLRERANELGVRSADCDECGASLDIALLTDARCPHCASTLATVKPKRGFFGSPTLETGDRPALEAPEVPVPDGVDVGDVLADGDGMSDEQGDEP